MNKPEGKLQWALSIGIYHDASFGHRVELWYGPTSRAPKVRSGGSWQGLGIPEAVLSDLRAVIDATVTEHIVTRYGVAGELPLKWGGDPDPF